MKHAIKTTLFLSLLSISACKAEAQSLNGLYEQTHKMWMSAPLDNGKCVPPNEGDENSCVEISDATNQLALNPLPDGNLEFAALLWFSEGHSCTIHQTAHPYQNGWRFESNAAGDLDKCILDIVVENKDIVFKPDTGARCSSYCGARGYFDGITFPLYSRTGPAPDNMGCELSISGDECEQ